MMERRRGEEARRSAKPFTIGVCTWTDEDLDRFQLIFRQYQVDPRIDSTSKGRVLGRVSRFGRHTLSRC